MNTLTIMVNLWLCFSLRFCLPLLPHTSLCLVLSAVASQDWADRRRVGSINRNWTNYKADVSPLWWWENTAGWQGVCGSFTTSLSSCSLLFYSLSPCLPLTLVSMTVWVSSSSFLPFTAMFLIRYLLNYFTFSQTPCSFLCPGVIFVITWSHDAHT